MCFPESLSLCSQEVSPISRGGITCHHGHVAEPCQLQWWARCSGGLSEQFAKPFISLIREQMDCLLLKAVGSLGSTIASDFWPARGLGKNPCPEPHFPDEEPEVRRDKWLVRAAGPRLLGKPVRFWWCGRAGQLTRKKPKPSHNSSNFLLSHVYHHSYIVTGYKYNSTQSNKLRHFFYCLPCAVTSSWNNLEYCLQMKKIMTESQVIKLL